MELFFSQNWIFNFSKYIYGADFLRNFLYESTCQKLYTKIFLDFLLFVFEI